MHSHEFAQSAANDDEPLEFHGLARERDNDRLFAALADPYRRSILVLLCRRRTVIADELVIDLNLTESSAREHLDVLVTADLVTVTNHGDADVYAINVDTLGDVAQLAVDWHSEALKYDDERSGR